MRIPIPVVLLLSGLVISLTWWIGAKDADFLSPPTEARLEQVRAEVRSSLPTATDASAPNDLNKPAVQPIPQPPPAEPKPAIELGDLASPPALNEYLDIAPKGAAHLTELALLLETEGEFQRALIAWERILDSGKPDATQVTAAISAIRRLRPTLPDWNTSAERRIPVVLHAGTSRKTATMVKPALEELAKELQTASSGILAVTCKITAGKDAKRATGPAPVALWLAGPAEKARSTEVLSFTIQAKETLPDELRKTAFELIRGYVGRGIQQSPPPPAADGGSVQEALNSHITRMLWKELGILLNHPPEKSN